MSTIFWAGDSTVQYNSEETFPQVGLGQIFEQYTAEGVAISNHGKNGRSTLSFIDEYRLVPIYDKITKGDYLFIQFGHNDEKIEDPARYTEPGGTYDINLEKFANLARNKKAIPVFISPVTRNLYMDDGTLKEDKHIPYTNAMRETAKRLGAAFIDLNKMSVEALKSAGADEVKQWYVEDGTHLVERGAKVYCELIAKALKELGGDYALLVK